MNLQILNKQLKEIIPYQLKINGMIECKRCGWCCKSNYTNIDQNEIVDIIKYLGTDFDAFYNTYMEQTAVENYLKRPCPFLSEDNKCTIYSVRPKVCREYPFQEYRLYCEPCKKGEELKQFIDQVNVTNRERSLRHTRNTKNIDKAKEQTQKEMVAFNETINKSIELRMPPRGENEKVSIVLLPLDPSYFIELYRCILRHKGKK